MTKPRSKGSRNVYIVDGSRTPFLRARGVPGNFSASDLAVQSARPLLLRQNFDPEQFYEVILGCTNPAADEANIARLVSLRLGCGNAVPAWTVQRNCGSGMQAVDSASQNIADGYADLILAGGTEAMSQAPILLNKTMVGWLGNWMQARTTGQRLRALIQLRPEHLKPVFSLLLTLRDPVIGLSMGRTAEILAYRFGIPREELDNFAVMSHKRLAVAQTQHRLEEIEIIFDQQGRSYWQDDGVRPDSNSQSLAKLKPVFDKSHGLVTAGNSAQVSDGAAWLVLASEQAVEQHQLNPLARLVDCVWVGLEPSQMGLGPAHAIAKLLSNTGLDFDAIDQWEINEAFSAQVLACTRALADTKFCRDELGLRSALGEINPDSLNVDGGGLSLGHPVGASGARIILHLMKTLRRTGSDFGVASLCIGGGQGGAMLLEKIHD